MITFFHVHKAYPGGHVALDDVCLTIERGEFAIFTGPSGAGKSSLLRAIMFELHPDRGEVVVETFRSSKAKRRQIPRLRRQLGVVFQDFKLLRDRSVFENVAFALHITGVDDPRKIKERTLGVLHRVGIYERRNALPRELSGGEQQRVGVARALVNDPIYLLADEPTGDLDPRAGDEIFALLREISRRGTAVLVATHDPSRADPSRDRLFQVERGTVREHPRPVRQVEQIERIEPVDEP
jgi:cell division transport system ATP-binding protein